MSEVISYEGYLIGACLRDATLINNIDLQPGDFLGESHPQAWKAIKDLNAEGEIPDLIAVADATGLPITFLSELMRECHSTDLEVVTGWGKIIYSKARRRTLVSGMLALAQSDYDVDTMLHHATEVVLGAQEQVRDDDESNTEIIDARIMALESRMLGTSSHIGLTFGVPEFDELSYGMLPSELVVLAARPAMGKTAKALQAARINAMHGKRVLVFSLEMEKGELFDRMICQGGKVFADRYAKPAQDDSDLYRDIGPTVKGLKAADIKLVDNVFDIEGITALARRHHQAKPVDLIVVDYLQLIGTKGNRNMNRAVEVGEYSRALKMLAMHCKCPVLLLSQLNRDVEKRPDKRPLMADLRESGSVEQDANKIIMLYRDEVYNEQSDHKGVAEIILRKHRGGPTGTVMAAGKLRYFAFEPLQASDYARQPTNNDPFA